MNDWIGMFLPGLLTGIFLAWGTNLRIDRLRREKQAKADEDDSRLQSSISVAVQSAFIDERMRILKEKNASLFKGETNAGE